MHKWNLYTAQTKLIERLWYTRHPLRWILLPMAWIYRFIVLVRRYYLEHVAMVRFPVPIIVVGNLTVGGVGKTPLVIALAKQLKAKGVRVGIVSRGYGAKVGRMPVEVFADSDATVMGDEPLLLAKKTACPVVIAPKRVRAVQYLLEKYQSQVIISDDGLQHYAMGRSVEIVVIDGMRGLGNGHFLPAGPLREGISRLKQVDFIVVNGHCPKESAFGKILHACDDPRVYHMDFLPGDITGLLHGQSFERVEENATIAAVAGIGHPERFFAMLKGLNIDFKPYPFQDHHPFSPKDLHFKETMILMTEKDAVKCQSFATNSMYVLPINAVVEDTFWDALWSHKQLGLGLFKNTRSCKNESYSLL